MSDPGTHLLPLQIASYDVYEGNRPSQAALTINSNVYLSAFVSVWDICSCARVPVKMTVEHLVIKLVFVHACFLDLY